MMFAWTVTLSLTQVFVTPEAIEFDKVKLVGRVERNVSLRLEPDRLVIRSRGDDLKTLSYGQLKAAEYSHSARPGGKSGMGALDRKHWLTLSTKSESIVLQLSEKNYRLILRKFEGWTGMKVEAVAREKQFG